jgi:hypothetical protein
MDRKIVRVRNWVCSPQRLDIVATRGRALTPGSAADPICSRILWSWMSSSEYSGFYLANAVFTCISVLSCYKGNRRMSDSVLIRVRVWGFVASGRQEMYFVPAPIHSCISSKPLVCYLLPVRIHTSIPVPNIRPQNSPRYLCCTSIKSSQIQP